MLEPYADQLVVARLPGESAGSVALYLALLATTVGDWPEAEAYFAAAAATHERIRAPTWLARTRLEWARMLLTRAAAGDADELTTSCAKLWLRPGSWDWQASSGTRPSCSAELEDGGALLRQPDPAAGQQQERHDGQPEDQAGG